MKMKHLFLLLSLMAAPLTISAQNAGDLTQFLPSNWGGWQNLTYGVADSTEWSTGQKPLEVQISGSTIHVAWMELVKQNDGNYPLYYRRSLDNGKTWEKPRIIAVIDKTYWTSSSTGDAIGGCNSHWMQVDGKSVHFALPFWSKDGKHSFSYIRSTDGGATFTSQVLWETTATYIDASRPHVASDGQNVVVAVNVDSNKPYVWTSSDGGKTFNLTKINENYKLADLQVSGKRWTILGFLDSGQAYDRWSRVFFSTSADGGKTVSTENMAYAASNGKTYSTCNCLHAPSYAYHPQMVQQGNTIDLMYIGSLSNGNEGDPDPGYDKNHTIHRRSTDGGKTWSEARYMPESTGSHGTIAAKGDNVYVYTTCKGQHAVYHSHDGGKTWEVQQQAVLWDSNDQWNPSNSYQLYIAPDDASGQHVYLTGSRAYLAESKDGFRTLCRNFVRGKEVWSWDGGSCIENNALIVQLDSQGKEHWFMWYRPLHQDNKYFWTVCHRIHEPEPNTGSTNKALNITNPKNKYNKIEGSNQVIVPMTTSLHEIKKAITVECWVRPDTVQTFQIASLTHDTENAEGSIYNGGWYISTDLSYSEGNFFTFKAGITTDEMKNGLQVWNRDRYRIMKEDLGMWHHVAITYDADVKANNFCLYVDGFLFATATQKGDIMQGDNPIVIGGSGGYNESNALVDNFAIWDHALSQDELRSHIYQAPTGKEKGCRLLLTFDGSLQDKSPYHNDGMAIRNLVLTQHDGIRPPHPDFIAAKDMTGKKVTLTDATEDGEAAWWIANDPWNLNNYMEKYRTFTTNTVKQDYSDIGSSRFNGTYTYWLITKGKGNCNAFASTMKQVVIGGLNQVFPTSAGQADGVELRIEGGYTLTYNSQPRVLLKRGNTEIEGKWLVERGYDVTKLTSADDLSPAVFNLSGAALGKYDVIVGTDTLRQAFTVEQSEEVDVWAQISGRGLQFFNRWTKATINFGNNSNVPAYNVPFFICITNIDGNTDIAFDFDTDLPNYCLDEKGEYYYGQFQDYMMAYDEKRGDSIRVYAFLIPYIAPNSTCQKSFRLKVNKNSISDTMEIFWQIEQPWGLPPADNTPAGARRRAIWTLDQWECMMKKFGQQVAWDGILGQIPGLGCAVTVGKTLLDATKDAYTQDKSRWSNLGKNMGSMALSCLPDLLGVGVPLKVGFILGSFMWSAMNTYWDRESCLEGDLKKGKVRGATSIDPNEMIGPDGPDDNAHYIQPIHQMPYTITFENKASATAPANEVFVTDTLDLSKYDAETFGFSGFGWADNSYSVGGSYTKEFTRDVEYKVNGHDILVRVSAQFDPATGIAHWAFVSLEKNGDELKDIMNGFLLPNKDSGVGEGFVSFVIEHKKNPANGSTVSNKATIIFDANEPITTNTYVNTFDTDYPTSKITKLTEEDGFVYVTIEGSDKTSGIDYYDLYYYVNDSDSAIAIPGVNATQRVPVPVEPGKKYGFCVLATDRVGWHEPKDLKPEKTITTSGSSVVTYNLAVADAGYATFFDSKSNYSLPSGLKASTVSGISGGRLSYQALSGNIVPKGTAVLIEASQKKAATYTLTSTTDAASYNGDNLLHGSDVATTTTANGSNVFYKLAYGPSGTSLAKSFGWFWGAKQGAAFSIEAHRAWLAVPKAVGSPAYIISGGETGVEEIENDPSYNRQYIDLQGRRIEKPTQPGIYILNGRKVVVK